MDATDNLPVVQDYNTIISDTLASFLAVSRKIGGDLPAMVDHVSRLFDAQRQFIRKAIQSKKPTNDQQIQELIKPQSTEIEAICGKEKLFKIIFHEKIIIYVFLGYTNKNRKSPLFNHLSAISEGIPALGWILVSPTPAPHIKEMSDAAQFYANRVLKEFKEKDPTHVEWVKQWIKVLTDLHAYVKQYHTTGLTWGAHGQQDAANATAPACAGAGGAPPPPPPPPSPASLLSAVHIDDGPSRAELLNSINALGTGATSLLKKVPDDLKLHKNPQLREQSGNKPTGQPNVANKSQVGFIFHSQNRSFDFSYYYRQLLQILHRNYLLVHLN